MYLLLGWPAPTHSTYGHTCFSFLSHLKVMWWWRCCSFSELELSSLLHDLKECWTTEEGRMSKALLESETVPPGRVWKVGCQIVLWSRDFWYPRNGQIWSHSYVNYPPSKDDSDVWIWLYVVNSDWLTSQVKGLPKSSLSLGISGS